MSRLIEHGRLLLPSKLARNNTSGKYIHWCWFYASGSSYNAAFGIAAALHRKVKWGNENDPCCLSFVSAEDTSVCEDTTGHTGEGTSCNWPGSAWLSCLALKLKEAAVQSWCLHHCHSIDVLLKLVWKRWGTNIVRWGKEYYCVHTTITIENSHIQMTRVRTKQTKKTPNDLFTEPIHSHSHITFWI